MKKSILFFTILSLILLTTGCKEKLSGNTLQGADNTVLTTWLEKIMLPAYKNYQTKSENLVEVAKEFNQNTNEATFSALKESWKEAYKAYQHTMFLDIDVAFNISYLGMSNTYPTAVSPENPNDKYNIESNIALIANGETDKVSLKSTPVEAKQAYQGFPALDYLLFAEGKDVAYFTNNPAAKIYVVMLTEALKNHIDTVLSYWMTNKDKYINDTDKTINGSYARTLNAFVRVYEKNIRSFKVGLAAGAIRIQNGVPQPEIIEGYYNEEISKELLKIALKSSQDFFNGKEFNGTKEHQSLKQILISINKQDLVNEINNQYDLIYKKIDAMPNSLKYTAKNNTSEMVELYNLIQVNVAKYKTEMLSALKASVDYADTDGD